MAQTVHHIMIILLSTTNSLWDCVVDITRFRQPHPHMVATCPPLRYASHRGCFFLMQAP